MSNQQEFDTKIAAINTKLDSINEAITAETQQIADFIAANPAVDTSALDNVVARLGVVSTSVSEIFTPETE